MKTAQTMVDSTQSTQPTVKDPADFTIEGNFLLGDGGPTVIEYRRPNHCLCWSLWISEKHVEFSACLDDMSMLRLTKNNILIARQWWVHVAADRNRNIWSINVDGISLCQTYESRSFDANLWEASNGWLLPQPQFYAPPGNLISDFRISKGASRCHANPLPDPGC